jgi:hypothetical protein
MFFSRPTQEIITSRFDHCSELASFARTLQALKDRNNRLAVRAKKNGQDSTDAKKYCIISIMLGYLDTAIENYNKRSIAISPEEEQQALVQLINSLRAIIADTLGKHIHLLMTPRNNKKLAANIAVQSTLVAGTVGGVWLLPVSWPLVIAAAFTANVIVSQGREVTGLSNPVPASTQLIYKLLNKLDQAYETLSFTLKRQIILPNYYEILGLEPYATLEEIKEAYHHLAKKHHPDRLGNSDMFIKITAAYAVLSDPESRREYDNMHSNFNQENSNTLTPKYA